ncbi:Uncharacterised protein [Metamycoplasma arthritidis]|uniref:Ribosomal protein L4 n=1 Tax=Metamycoplasma arthritidis (strain 158L3-1) TaxID=243272 RepID=B3PM46_META1|nr:hypothetical protein [Metamycoplasma arthritidis]ACF07098.1 ribosomal protein L4 [Metamycoplasma arthritidis 158L3-1]VEU78626.1 Uncharacterised protein [Metamycoplasma arthritidis]
MAKNATKSPTRKNTLERFYISEVTDKKTKKIIFRFKKANQKTHREYEEFNDAVSEFIRISETTANNTRVWFHREGAYRGSVDLEKARKMLIRLAETKVANEEVIEFIEHENLVDKPTSKTTEILAIQKTVDLEEESKYVEFDVANRETMKASEVSLQDLVISSAYDVEIEQMLPNNDNLDIYFRLKKDDQKSSTVVRTLSGFKRSVEPVIIPEEITEAPTETQEASKPAKKRDTTLLGWIIFLSIAVVVNIIFIILLATKVIAV